MVYADAACLAALVDGRAVNCNPCVGAKIINLVQVLHMSTSQDDSSCVLNTLAGVIELMASCELITTGYKPRDNCYNKSLLLRRGPPP